jgi:hypothetical protein
LEIDSREAWNAWNIDAAFGKGALYPPASALITNNYPPLSFFILGAISLLIPKTLMIGRVVSVISVLVIGATAFFAARRIGASRPAALFGGFWFIGISARFYYDFVGANDPNLLAVAIMSVGFYILITGKTRLTDTVALLIMILAGFTKHNVIATPIVGLYWLNNTDKGRFYFALCMSFLFLLLGFALCYSVFGQAFFDQLAMPRSASILRPFSRLGRLQWVLPALVICLPWLTSRTLAPMEKLIRSFIAVSLAVNFIAETGDGVGNNPQFELLFATAIALALAVDSYSQKTFSFRSYKLSLVTFITSVLVIRLIASGVNDPYQLLLSKDYRQNYANDATIALHEIDRIRRIDGPVSCSIKSICYLAGKDFVFDPWAMGQRLRTGRMTQSELDKEIRKGGIKFEGIDQRASWPRLGFHWTVDTNPWRAAPT